MLTHVGYRGVDRRRRVNRDRGRDRGDFDLTSYIVKLLLSGHGCLHIVMPGVQDGLKSRNIAKSSREAGPAPQADDDVHPPPTRKRKYQEAENGSKIWDSFTIKV